MTADDRRQPLRILSLGAGVQSSTVLLRSLAGELPPLDAAIFADTGWEPQGVYTHLERLEAAAAAGGVPVHRVTAGDIRADALDPGHRFASMPLFVANQRGGDGMLRRQCTREYKIAPIHKLLTRLRAEAGSPPVEQWFGISSDETVRMRSPTVLHITNVYPLCAARVWVQRADGDRRQRFATIDGLEPMTRGGCHQWLTRHGWTAPRSACIGCPLHTDGEWERMREQDPAAFADAVAFDAEIRGGHPSANAKGSPLRGEAFLHRSRLPLDQVGFASSIGQGSLLDGFSGECEGMCGV